MQRLQSLRRGGQDRVKGRLGRRCAGAFEKADLKQYSGPVDEKAKKGAWIKRAADKEKITGMRRRGIGKERYTGGLSRQHREE